MLSATVLSPRSHRPLPTAAAPACFSVADRQRLIASGWCIVQLNGERLADLVHAYERFNFIAYQYASNEVTRSSHKDALTKLLNDHSDYSSSLFLSQLSSLYSGQSSKQMHAFMYEPAYRGELAIHPDDRLFCASLNKSFSEQMELVQAERAVLQAVSPGIDLIIGNAPTTTQAILLANRQRPQCAQLLGNRHGFAVVRSTTLITVPGRDQFGNSLEVDVQLTVGAVNPYKGITVDSISRRARRHDVGIWPFFIPAAAAREQS